MVATFMDDSTVKDHPYTQYSQIDLLCAMRPNYRYYFSIIDVVSLGKDIQMKRKHTTYGKLKKISIGLMVDTPIKASGEVVVPSQDTDLTEYDKAHLPHIKIKKEYEDILKFSTDEEEILGELIPYTVFIPEIQGFPNYYRINKHHELYPLLDQATKKYGQIPRGKGKDTPIIVTLPQIQHLLLSIVKHCFGYIRGEGEGSLKLKLSMVD